MESEDIPFDDDFHEKDLSIWETKYLKRIRICDMKTQHIKNSIKKIERENWRLEYLHVLKQELSTRKEI